MHTSGFRASAQKMSRSDRTNFNPRDIREVASQLQGDFGVEDLFESGGDSFESVKKK